MTNRILDVAIVGGGISGVYAGWRLLHTGSAVDVAVFEGSDHIGGRLLSAAPPGIPNMMAELGGMRIMDESVQPLVNALIKILNQGASPEQEIKNFRFEVGNDKNIAYLRGTHLRNGEFTTAPDKVPYRLTFQEYGHNVGSLMEQAIEQIVPGITSERLDDAARREMARNAEFEGRPLHEQGFWQVLARVMSGEAYQLAVDAGGYQSVLTNWNAADAIPWFLADFGKNVKYFGFKSGFQQVPLRVADKFREAGGAIHLNKRLTGFQWEADVVTLSFATDEGPPEDVRARALILAMPRRALELITDESPLLQRADVRALIRSVTPQPLFKLFTTYAYPWWLPAGVAPGRTTTDLPVRQTYYWPTNEGKVAERGPAMLMASYDDGLNVGFWDGFRDKRGSWGRPKSEECVPRKVPFIGPAEVAAEKAGDLDPQWRANHAPEVMVAEVQRQLMAIHGLSHVPRVEAAAYRDWGDNPFGGGWNSWNIGVKSWKVRAKIVQPVPDVPLYICGEAYSEAQGWVEGALETAEMVLARLGVPPLPIPSREEERSS